MILKAKQIQGVIYIGVYVAFMGALVFHNGWINSSFLIVLFGLGLYTILLPMNNNFEINEQTLIVRNPLKIKNSAKSYLLKDITQAEIYSPKHTRTKSYFLRIYTQHEGRKTFNISKHEWVTLLSQTLKAKGLLKQ